ncbi:hypothetical protein Emed_007043 [Eimeria media]
MEFAWSRLVAKGIWVPQALVDTARAGTALTAESPFMSRSDRSSTETEGLRLGSRVVPRVETTRVPRGVRTRPNSSARREGAGVNRASGKYMTPQKSSISEMFTPGGETGVSPPVVHIPAQPSMLGTTAPTANVLGQQAGVHPNFGSGRLGLPIEVVTE